MVMSMSQQGWHGKARQGLALTLIALQVWQPALAGVVATTAGVTQDQAANGVPIVNIAAPGAAGISHNRYSQFDVDRAGLILNNSGQPVNTQLGGYVPGNANLGHGSARLILNEVSGKLPSQLHGYMEIAGQKAEMVIANPAGITCNGCGFINTNRATLTTGVPQFGSDGALSGFRVDSGEMRFEGAGLNATNIERLALYSRALTLNAELHANDLQLVTGSNAIDASNGHATASSTATAAPAFAIDSSSLGGMYANRITLVGTEAGVGMRLAGPIAALTGTLEISSTGDVRLARTSSALDLTINSSGHLALNGLTTVGTTLVADAHTLTLDAAAQLSAGAVTLAADSIDTHAESALAARQTLNITASTLSNAGDMAAGDTLGINSQTVHNSGTLAGKNGVTLTTDSLQNNGRIEGGSGQMRVEVTGALDNRAGKIHHSGDILTVTGGTLANQQGEIISNGQVTITATSLLQNGDGVLQGNQSLTLHGQGLDNTTGGLHSNGDIRLNLNNAALINMQGLIATTGSIVSTTMSSLSNQEGALRAGQNIALALPDFDSARIGGQLSAAGELRIVTQGDMRFSGTTFTTPGALILAADSHDIVIENRIEAGDNTAITASHIVLGDAAMLATQAALVMTADVLVNEGIIFGRQGIALTVDSQLDNGNSSTATAAAILSEGNITLQGMTHARTGVLNNYAGVFESLNGNITLATDRLNNINLGWATTQTVDAPVYTYSPSKEHFDTYYYHGISSYNGLRAYQYESITTHNDVLSQGVSGQIISAGDIHLDLDILNNDHSIISAGELLGINATTINNSGTTLTDMTVVHTEARWHNCKKHSNGNTTCNNGAELLAPAYIPGAVEVIPTILEGATVDVHSAVFNGTPEHTGRTVSTGAGAFANMPDQAPQDQSPSAGLALSILDPTQRPGFTLPGNGLFQRNSNPLHSYLIETDPALNTYAGFLGSGYLLDHLNWSPAITQRRLGDSYYELMLVREVLLATLGSRFVDAGIADERQQFEYLTGNAIAASEALHLSPGIALSRAQIDALQQDILWLEEKTVMGERVLVPVVYLAQGSARVLTDGAVITGGSVHIDGDRLRNAGLVRARDSIDVKVTAQLDNLGGAITSAGRVHLQSGGDIRNDSGHIAGQDVSLLAEGDITHRTWSERDSIGTAANGAWSTRVGDTATVIASGQMTQMAGGDIRLVGASLEGDSVALAAGNSITLDTVQVDQGYRHTGGNLQQLEDYTRQLQTQVMATLDLSLSAGNSITAIAAKMDAGRDVSLTAGNSINLLAAEETDHYEQHTQDNGTLTDKSRDVVHNESRLLGTQLSADGNVRLSTQAGDITLYGSTVSAEGQADVQSGGNLNLIAGVNTTSHSEQSSSTNAATYKKHSEGYIEQTAVGSGISSQGDLTLTAGKDINLVASGLSSQATLRIGSTEIAGGHLNGNANSSLPVEEGQGEGAAALPLNLNVSTLELTNESWNETQKGLKGPLKEVVKVVSAVAGYLVSVFSAGQVEMPEIDIGSHDNSHNKDVLQASSMLSAQDMQIRVQNTAAFIGATVNVDGTLAVSANDIVIDAVAETHSQSHDEGSDTVKGLGLKLNDDEVRIAGVQETKTSLSDTQNLTEWRGTSINAGQLILNAENNIDILGSQLTVVGDAIVEAGGDLTIAGREGEVTQEHKETTEVITVAAAVRNAYVDAVLAVKAVDEAKDALKDAKDAHDEAKRKVGLGQLDASDLDYYKVNMAAAAANLAQATIAAAASIAIAAATTGTGGFYASGSADRDKTVTTSTSTQSQWQGSEINVGGSALLSAGDTLKVQGSNVGVADTLYLDAKKIELIAGQERATEKTKTTEEHEGVSVSASSVGVNASQRDTDADSSSLHYVNTHLSAGAIASRSDTLRVAGAQLYAGDIAIETDQLTVASLQDESQSKSQMRGMSAGVGTSSISAGMEKSDSSASRLWVSEQTQIIGSNSIRIRAKDSTLTGAIIANAAYDENGQLIDKGNLDFQTDTLAVNDLHDVSKSKTTGFSLSTSINTDGYKASAGQPKTGQTTIGGQYYGHETQQITRATLGGGAIVVGGKMLDENNANELGLASLNRDLDKAQEITVDKDIGGLNASVTIDHRLLTADGRAAITKDFKTSEKLGEDIYTAAKSIATNDNLGVTNIGNLIHNNTQATKLAEALLENPENSWIVEGLKDKNGESYPDALKATAQIAQSLFGVKPTDVAFYDAMQTTSSSLEDNADRDVLGAAVTDKSNSEYGNIFIDASGQATKESLAATAGHEVIETRVLQTGRSGLFFNDSDPTKEALADDFGARLTARLNEATGNGLATSTNDWRFGLQQSQAVTAGTLRADAVGNASVEYRLPTYDENRRLTQLAHGNEALGNDLFAVTCAEIRCSAEFVYGSPEYKYYRRLEEQGEHPANGLAQKLIQQEQNRTGDLFEYGLMDRAEDAATLAKNQTIRFGEWESSVAGSVGHTLVETAKIGVDFLDFIGAGIAQQAPEPMSQLGKNLQEQGPQIFLTIIPDTVKTVASAIEGDPQAVGGLLGGALVGGATARLTKLGAAADTLVMVEPKFTPTSIANNDVSITPLYQGMHPEINFGNITESFGVFDDATLADLQALRPTLGAYNVPNRLTPLTYDISKWGEHGLPSDGYFARTLNERQAFELTQGNKVEFGGKPTDGYPSGMGFVGSAEEVRLITTGAEYASKLDLTYQPKYLLEFQLKDPAGLRNVLDAPYDEFVVGGKTASGNLEWNYPGISSDNIANWNLKELK